MYGRIGPFTTAVIRAMYRKKHNSEFGKHTKIMPLKNRFENDLEWTCLRDSPKFAHLFPNPILLIDRQVSQISAFDARSEGTTLPRALEKYIGKWACSPILKNKFVH